MTLKETAELMVADGASYSRQSEPFIYRVNAAEVATAALRLYEATARLSELTSTYGELHDATPVWAEVRSALSVFEEPTEWSKQGPLDA